MIFAALKRFLQAANEVAKLRQSIQFVGDISRLWRLKIFLAAFD
jgi:hypothetical protein